MLWRHISRTRRRRIIRSIVLTASLFLLLDFLGAVLSYKIFNDNLSKITIHRVEQLPLAVREQKIFIAAQFWTSADVLLDHWQDATLKLIDALGPSNVYLSIVATRGQDNTNEILQQFENDQLAALNVSRTIVLDPSTHDDAIKVGEFDADMKSRPGWIHTGDSKTPGRKELRRIPYLAKIRNRSLEPLEKLKQEYGITFDKILFLGDVIYQPSDVLTLLATNSVNFDVACSIDYRLDKRFYDTFVLRDAGFETAITRYFPIFRSRASRNAVIRGRPVPVTSCWNGMVAADARPYYSSTSVQHSLNDPSNPSAKDSNNNPALRFRGIPDSLATLRVEASEACLIHADAIAQGHITKGMFMNPAVRVGYTRYGYQTTAYDDVHIGTNKLGWLTLTEYIQGIWINRRARYTRYLSFWTSASRSSSSSSVMVQKKLAQWKAQGREIGQDRTEVGEYCLINEMQILTSDGKGWKHIGGQVQY